MKIYRFLLTLVLFLSATTQLLADYTYERQGITYTIKGSKENKYAVVTTVERDLKDVIIRDSVPDEDGIDCPVRVLSLEGLNDNRVMTSISFPPTLTQITIGYLPFEYDPFPETLREVHIRDLEAWINLKYVDLYKLDSYLIKYYYKCSPLYLLDSQLYLNEEIVRDLVIPEGVSQVNNLVFCGNKFNSITIPASLSRINGFAFKPYDDSSLKAVYAPDLKTWCGINYAPYIIKERYSDHHFSEYYYYSSLLKEGTLLYLAGEPVQGELSFPDDITAINAHTFQNYSYITCVSIGKNIESIGGSAFADCKNLSTVRYEEGVTDVPEMSLDPWEEEYNGNSADYTYRYDSNLNISTLYLPSTTTSITFPGFMFAENLRNVVIRATVPPEIKYSISGYDDYMHGWYDVFSDWTYQEGTLYVPEGTAELYRNTGWWKRFKNITEEEYDDVTTDVQAVEDSMSGGIDYSRPYEIYSVSGMRMGCSYDELPAGIYIIRQNGMSRKIVRN